MEAQTPPTLVAGQSTLKLKPTKAPEGQEWCAITYALVKEPKTLVYGAYKILCFGHTCEEVEQLLGKMFASNELEKDLPFLQIIKTGEWRKLVVGGEKSDQTLRMNTEDGTVESQVLAEKNKKNVENTKELQAQMERVKAESEGKLPVKPYSDYKRWRTQREMAINRKKQLEHELKIVNQALGHAVKNIKRIESQHGNFRLKFDRKYKIQPSPPDIAKLEEEVPVDYEEPTEGVKLNPREHDDVVVQSDSDEE